jgi:hypothetical protein
MDRDRCSAQLPRQPLRVIAGVEDAEGWRCDRPGVDDRANLLDGDGVGVLGGVNPADVQRRSPAIGGVAELSNPLVRPAGDDRLASGVAGGMLGEATVGAGFGVASWPDARVDRIDRCRLVEGMPGEEGADRLGVDLAAGEVGIPAPPAVLGSGSRPTCWRTRRRNASLICSHVPSSWKRMKYQQTVFQFGYSLDKYRDWHPVRSM